MLPLQLELPWPTPTFSRGQTIFLKRLIDSKIDDGMMDLIACTGHIIQPAVRALICLCRHRELFMLV